MASLTDIESIMRSGEIESEAMSSENTVELNLNTPSFTEAVNQVTNNPEMVAEAMEETMSQMSPQMIEQARRLANGGNAAELMTMMKKKGVNIKKIKSDMKQQKKLQNRAAVQLAGPTQSVILITTGRKHKLKSLHINNMKDEILKIVGESGIELSCSRLAVGPLEGSSIKLWYNTSYLGKNKRTTKLIGFPIGGPAIIVADRAISIDEFLAAEKMLD